MARTDRVGEIAGGAARSGGRGRVGSSTYGVAKPKTKAPSAKAKKIQKLPEQRAARFIETGKSAKDWKPTTPGQERRQERWSELDNYMNVGRSSIKATSIKKMSKAARMAEKDWSKVEKEYSRARKATPKVPVKRVGSTKRSGKK